MGKYGGFAQSKIDALMAAIKDSAPAPQPDAATAEQEARERVARRLGPPQPDAASEDDLACAECGTSESACEGLADDLGERCCKGCHHVDAAPDRPGDGGEGEVQRWEYNEQHFDLVRDSDGEWVRHEDHERALAAEREARERAEARIHLFLVEEQEWKETVERLAAERDEAIARLERSVSGQVLRDAERAHAEEVEKAEADLAATQRKLAEARKITVALYLCEGDANDAGELMKQLASALDFDVEAAADAAREGGEG